MPFLAISNMLMTSFFTVPSVPPTTGMLMTMFGSNALYLILLLLLIVFLAMLVLGERLTAMQWLGSAVILLGLVICNFGMDPVRKLAGASAAR